MVPSKSLHTTQARHDRLHFSGLCFGPPLHALTIMAVFYHRTSPLLDEALQLCVNEIASNPDSGRTIAGRVTPRSAALNLCSALNPNKTVLPCWNENQTSCDLDSFRNSLDYMGFICRAKIPLNVFNRIFAFLDLLKTRSRPVLLVRQRCLTFSRNFHPHSVIEDLT